jgi:hypothetical protein
MKCEQVQQELYEGALSGAGAEHVSACPECLRIQRALASLERDLRFEVKPAPNHAEFKKRLIAQRLPSIEPEGGYAGWIRLARAAVVAAALMLAFILPNSGDRTSKMQTISGVNHEVPFELQKVDDDVVKLSWKGDPRDHYRIYKGASPASMKPIESVRGREWIDRAADSSPITFYRVEEL